MNRRRGKFVASGLGWTGESKEVQVVLSSRGEKDFGGETTSEALATGATGAKFATITAR